MKIPKRLLVPVITAVLALIVFNPVSANASGGTTPTPFLTSPANDGTVIGNINLSFSLPVNALPGSVSLTIVGNTPNYARIFLLKQELAGSYTLSFNPLDMKRLMLMNYSSYFSDVVTTLDGNTLGDTEYLPSGTYSILVAYRDQSQGSPSSAQVDRVLITSPCTQGTYSTNGGVPLRGECSPAPVGSYVPTIGATSATACPQGETTNGIGSTSAVACHRSSTPLPQLVSPINNDVVSGNISVQFSLPVQASTTTVKIRIFNSDLSRLITLSNYQSGVQTHSFDPRASDSVLAGANALAFLSVATTTISDQSHFEGSLPIGNYQVEIQYQDEFLNPVARVSASTVLLSAPCEAGTFSTTGAKDANGYCTDASVGHFADSPGATHETPCPKGQYAPAPASWRCVDAAPNTYVDTLGASASTACPAHYTSASGSDSLSDCKKPAVAVKYCNIKKGKQATATCIATAASMKIPARAKLTITVAKADRKRCAVNRGKVLGNAKGICQVTLKVQPRKGKAVTYSSRIRVS